MKTFYLAQKQHRNCIMNTQKRCLYWIITAISTHRKSLRTENLIILHEDNHIIVVLKPQNVPSCEDASKDRDMLTIIKDYIREKYHKTGNVYLGLVHRLDRPTGGIMVYAKSSKAAARLSE